MAFQFYVVFSKGAACPVAGYGRKEAAEMLLEAGADPLVKNAAGQAPADAARANREMHMVKFLKSRGGEKSTQGSKYL